MVTLTTSLIDGYEIRDDRMTRQDLTEIVGYILEEYFGLRIESLLIEPSTTEPQI